MSHDLLESVDDFGVLLDLFLPSDHSPVTVSLWVPRVNLVAIL